VSSGLSPNGNPTLMLTVPLLLVEQFVTAGYSTKLGSSLS
jgi:hypothetical protein